MPLQTLQKALVMTYTDFAFHSSIHGLKYTVDKKCCILERIIWLTLVGVGCLGSGIMFNIFLTRFSTHPGRAIHESFLNPLGEVPIPTITICTGVKIVLSKLNKFISELNLYNYLEEDVRRGIEQLVEKDLSKVNTSALTILDEVLNLNKKTDVSSLVSSISPSCGDIMRKCRYEGIEIPCYDVFTDTFFEHERCCISFTHFVDSDGLFRNKPEKYTSYSNRNMGFNLIIEPNIEDVYLKRTDLGLTVMVHSQLDRSYNMNRAEILEIGTLTDLEIGAIVYKSTQRLRNSDPSIRQCYFKNENKLAFYKFYSSANCAVDAKLREIINTCGCTSFFSNMRNTGVQKCTNATILTCILKIENEPLPPECLSDCESIIYRITPSAMDLIPNSSYVINPFLNEFNFTSKTTVLNVFYGSQFHELMIRDSVTSAGYLFYSLGGTFSLFLGLNIISFVEIFYYLFVRLRINFKALKRITNRGNEPHRLQYPLDFQNTRKTVSRTVKVNYTLKAFQKY